MLSVVSLSSLVILLTLTLLGWRLAS